MKCGSADVALGYLNRAVELEAEDEVPLVVRSECLNKLDRPTEALEDANNAIELNPDSTRSFPIAIKIAINHHSQFFP